MPRCSPYGYGSGKGSKDYGKNSSDSGGKGSKDYGKGSKDYGKGSKDYGRSMSSMAAFTGPPRSTQISFRSRPLSLLCSRCFVALLAASGGLAGLSTTAALPAQPVRIDLIKDLPSAGDLAAPANGQTLYILDESRGEIIAIDPFEPAKRWTAVAAPADAASASAPAGT